MKTIVGLSLVALWLISTGSIAGAESQTITAKKTSEGKGLLARAPWRGTSVTLHNEVGVPTFDPSANLTYNPYWAMSLRFNAQWWFNDTFYMRGMFSLTREMTNSDFTTQQGEIWASDVTLRTAASHFYTIPLVDVDLSAHFDLIAPTSKVSQARTLVVGFRPTVQLSRGFDLLKGMNLSYRFSANKSLHRHTTAERDVPLISSCSESSAGCSEYLNTGSRNGSWRLTHSAHLSQQFTDWLGASITFGVVTDFLYDSISDPSVSLTPMVPENQRHWLTSDINIAFKPFKAMSISVGASSYHSQLNQSSSYQTPFFNRYTTVYVDLGLDVAGLISQISEG